MKNSHKTLLFPGSFDPFTIGHKWVVDKALTIADRVVIAIGVNENKKRTFCEEQTSRHQSKHPESDYSGWRMARIFHFCLLVGFSGDISTHPYVRIPIEEG